MTNVVKLNQVQKYTSYDKHMMGSKFNSLSS